MNFRVRQYLQYVHKYQNADNGSVISYANEEVKENVSPLIVPIEDDELAKRFDLTKDDLVNFYYDKGEKEGFTDHSILILNLEL